MDYAKRLFDLSLDMLCVAGMDGYFKELNAAFERTLGWSLEELRSKPFIDFVHPDDRAATLAEVAKLGRGVVTLRFENRYLCKDGTYKWLQWTSFPSGGLLHAVARDVTDAKEKEEQLRKAQAALQQSRDGLEKLVEERTAALKKSQEQLLQAQKMEAIGRLAGGIAHDFNNLLTVIVGYSDMILQQIPAQDPLRSLVDEVRMAGERAASLTRQLLAFSRRQIMQPRVVDLNEVVSKMDNMLRRLLGEDIDLVTRLHSDLSRVKVDPGQIDQVIMNLAVNARDAMPEGGKLTIETANVELDETYAREHVGAQPGPHVMLGVSDTGIGMSAEVQARLFEPFFTTKEVGKGTGLGLSTVYGIVKQSGGNIWVYSEPGQGTTFKVYLPRAKEEAAPARRETARKLATKGARTILVVEDEQGVRNLITRVLETGGYRVLAFGDAEAAIELSKQYRGAIDLLLTDVVLPKIGGRKVAEAILALRPDIKVLYMSGYTDNAIVHQGRLDPGVAFLEKPMRPSALLEKVLEVLGGGA